MCAHTDQHFITAISHSVFLSRLKMLTAQATHSHEQTIHALICDLESMVDHGIITHDEFATTIGKAADILSYFRYDIDGLVRENSWYRASVMHQMGCGMLQALRLMRPDLRNHTMLNESAYDLYRHQHPHPAAQAAQ